MQRFWGLGQAKDALLCLYNLQIGGPFQRPVAAVSRFDCFQCLFDM